MLLAVKLGVRTDVVRRVPFAVEQRQHASGDYRSVRNRVGGIRLDVVTQITAQLSHQEAPA